MSLKRSCSAYVRTCMYSMISTWNETHKENTHSPIPVGLCFGCHVMCVRCFSCFLASVPCDLLLFVPVTLLSVPCAVFSHLCGRGAKFVECFSSVLATFLLFCSVAV